MAFTKHASVTSLATATAAEDGGLCRTASLAAGVKTARSYYVDGSRKIDVRGLLSKVADKFQISSDPSDYIFEAIRANTTNVFNENHDGFHQKELWRFDLRLGMPVYHTYIGKPHHVNHRTENPKTARGVIVDVHYNDDAPPLEECPRCAAKTASREARDTTGIHCAKCGTVVKDEFVEALVAVDTKKDPVFAEGVRTGQLKASSMGCTCASTVCNVCEHVATSRPEFCDHIKAGNKGTLWARGANNKWARIEARAAAAEFTKRGLKFDVNDFCSLRAEDGYEVRKAAEYCEGVEYDELSRVDQPADPKALQREILRAAAVISGGEATPEALQAESAALIKAATAAAPTAKAAALDPALLAALRSLPPEDLAALQSELASTPAAPATEAPGHEHDHLGPSTEPVDIEDYAEDELEGDGFEEAQDEEQSTDELGIMPPGASIEETAAYTAARSARMYGESYKDWTVEVTAQGTARVVSPRGPVMLVRAATKPASVSDCRAFGAEILSHLFDHGLLKTAERYEAAMDAKFAQVVDYAVNDMKGFDDHYMADSILDDDHHDMAGVDKSKATSDVIGDGEDLSDRAEDRDAPPDSSIDDGVADHDERNEMAPPDGKPVVTKEDNSDMRDKRATPPTDALSGEQHDHKERLATKKHAERVEKLMAAKLAAASSAHDAALAAARADERSKYARALRIVAKRHARNLEISPLKESLGIVLANERTVGHDPISGERLDYMPVTPDVATHLIEAAWKDGGDAQIEELLTRAATLMDASDEYLKTAEADIERIAHVIPPVNASPDQSYTDLDRRAGELRQAAREGSMALAPTDESVPHATGTNKRASIQAALSGSLTSSKRNQFRPN